MKLKTLALALSLATSAAACVGSAPVAPSGGGDDVGDNGGSNGGGGGNGGSDEGSGGDDVNPQPQLDPTGTYKLASTFDIATNIPGTVGEITNQFISATDDPDDPTKYIVDLLIAQLPDGTIKDYAQDAESVVIGYLNDEVLSLAPTFVTDIKTVGQDFGDMTKNFGLVSQLQVTGTPGAYTSTHTITGVHFKIGTTESDYLFADYNEQNIVVPNVGITVDPSTGKFQVATHAVPLSYGEVLHIGLDAAILPMVDPNATDLGSFFSDEIDCAAVGQAVSDAVGIGSPSTYQTACTAGLTYAAGLIYQQIDNLDASPLTFSMAGTAKAFDRDGDGKVDQISAGQWSGMISYVGTPAPMATATFTGTRM